MVFVNKSSVVWKLFVVQAWAFFSPSFFMRRAFLLNISFLIFINLLIKPFYIFGIDRTIQNRVGLEDYGIYAALLNFTFLLQIINDFGIQNFNNRNIAQHHRLLPKYFPNILTLKLGLGTIYAALTITAAYLVGYQSSHFFLLFFFIINQILVSAILFFRSNISGLGFYRVDSLLTILDKLLLIIICGYLLWGNLLDQNFQIEWLVYAQTSSLLITTIVSFLLVFGALPYFKWSFKPAFLYLILKKSYPYALAIFLMTLYTRIDFVMIERLLVEGEKESGIYASAYRLLDAANILGLLFAGLLLPMFAKMLKEKIPIQSLLRLSLQILLNGAIVLAISVFFFRQEIMFLLYEDASFYAADILGVLMFVFVMVSGTYIYGTLLTANNSLTKLNWIFTISVGLNIFLNFQLIPHYGAFGAAITTLLTQIFAFIGQLIIAQKEFNLASDFQLIGQFSLLGIIVAGIAYYAYHFFPFCWFTNFSIALLAGVGVGFLLGLPRVDLLIALFKERVS